MTLTSFIWSPLPIEFPFTTYIENCEVHFSEKNMLLKVQYPIRNRKREKIQDMGKKLETILISGTVLLISKLLFLYVSES